MSVVKTGPRHIPSSNIPRPISLKGPGRSALIGRLTAVFYCLGSTNTRRRSSRIFKAAVCGLTTLILSVTVLAQVSGPQAQQTPPDDKDKSQTHRGRNRDLRAESGATSQSTLALPFKRAWEYLTSNAVDLPTSQGHMETFQPSLDGGRVYLPLPNPLPKGEVICLDRRSGSLLWSTDLGGWISVPIAVGKRAIYLVTEKPSADQSQSGGSISALDPITGLSLWVRDYTRPFTSPPAVDNDRLYVGSADGAFYAISTANGDVVWKVPTGDVVRSRPLITETAIYFGSDDGALRQVDKASGAEIWKYQTAGKITGCPVLDGRYLYLGSGDASVYCVDMEKRKLKWRYRTGAAIEASLVSVGDRLLVGSLDNFVYALSKSSGNHIWKRKMEDRVTECPLIDGDTTLIAPFRGDHVAMFLTQDGRRVNYYQLSKGDALIGEPLFSEGTLLLRTDTGLVVAVAQHPQEPKEAVKKP
jgi:outer membrane protein assembly factor BamB